MKVQSLTLQIKFKWKADNENYRSRLQISLRFGGWHLCHVAVGLVKRYGCEKWLSGIWTVVDGVGD